jgi:hypothetical protein
MIREGGPQVPERFNWMPESDPPIFPGSPMTPEYAWIHREGRKKRYEDKRVGGTVVVHFIKKNMWFLETAIALLEGEELSESEKFHRDEPTREVLHSPSSTLSPAFQRAKSKHQRR